MLIENCRASLLVDLEVMKMPYRSYLQGALFSAGYWWLCSAQPGLSGSSGQQSNHISKFDKKGKYLGRMTLIGSGHGSAFAMDGDEVLIAWFDSGVLRDEGGNRTIRRIPWVKDRKVKRSEAPAVPTGTAGTGWIVGGPLTGSGLNDFTLRRYINDSGSTNSDQFSLRSLANPGTVRARYRNKQIPPKNGAVTNYQGSITFAGDSFILYAATDARPQIIAQYSWPKNNSSEVFYKKPKSVLDVTNIPKNWKDWTGSHEPEGLCVYNGKLCFGIRFGGTGHRYFRIYQLDDGAGPVVPPPVPPAPPPPVKPPWPPVVTPPKPPTNTCPPLVLTPKDEPPEGEPQ